MTPPLRPLCLLGLASLALLGGCREPAPIIDLPNPPWVSSPAVANIRMDAAGLQGTAFRDAATDLEAQLMPIHDVPDGYGWWRMPVDSSVTWADVDAFYTDAFTRPPLAGSGFVRRKDLSSPEPSRYEFAL